MMVMMVMILRRVLSSALLSSWLIPQIVALNVTDLDCRMRRKALEYSKSINPDRTIQGFIFDALELDRRCDDIKPLPASRRRRRRRIMNNDSSNESDSNPSNATGTTKKKKKKLPDFCRRERNCIFVDYGARKRVQQDGSVDFPFAYVSQAFSDSRSYPKTTIVLRNGTHFLNETIRIGHLDSYLELVGYPGEDVWLSGGLPLEGISWDVYPYQDNVFMADLSDLFRYNIGKPPKIASLFSTHARWIRARYPNSNPERDQWGYASPHRLNYSLDQESTIIEWEKPPRGELPTFDYHDFSQRAPPYNKSDSALPEYNMYASGSGGVCAELWGEEAQSYWCSNASAGGWSNVDQECAMSGQLQIPVGMYYNQSSPVGRRMDDWSGDGIGGYVYAWHSQSWAMHMFEISATQPGYLQFAPGGGRQGGRNWCRCDQCTYAGGNFCGQNLDPPIPDDDRLISGTWIVENLLTELDAPGEFYFDPITNYLFFYPNGTAIPPPDDLRLAMLETLVDVQGAHHVAIRNVGFRDTAATFLGDWSAPSGGDWALHRGGAVFLERVEHVTVQNCSFSRLDGNAVFLSRYTRHVKILGSLFEWLGENAIATWGETNGYDATEGVFPMHTLVEGNVFRELGIFQKQSSAFGQAKAAKSIIRNNIMFNMPRAAINFNDMMGGGDVVKNNLIFNTCRESGDHGPINTWDRQPFLTTLLDGDKPSFVPLRRTIDHNFIFANYGASQGVDNDDGSSWYHVHHNVFYDAEGFKMDYGGHDSVFERNLVISYPDKHGQRCIGFGGFLPGHGHVVRHNKCIVPSNDREVAMLDSCHDDVVVEHNIYYSPNGTVTYHCRDNQDKHLPLQAVQATYGLELGSTARLLPSAATIVRWARATLHQHLESDHDEIIDT